MQTKEMRQLSKSANTEQRTLPQAMHNRMQQARCSAQSGDANRADAETGPKPGAPETAITITAKAKNSTLCLPTARPGTIRSLYIYIYSAETYVNLYGVDIGTDTLLLVYVVILRNRVSAAAPVCGE